MKPQIGDVFGRLFAIELQRRPRRDGKSDEYYFLCRCICGTVKYVRDSALRSGRVVSCGCYRAELQAERLTTTTGQYMRERATKARLKHKKRKGH